MAHIWQNIIAKLALCDAPGTKDAAVFNQAKEYASGLIKLYHQVEVKARHLMVGDVLNLFDGRFGTGVVESIEDGIITIVRPYILVDDDTKTDERCTPLIGLERFTVYQDSNRSYFLVEPRPERRCLLPDSLD